MPVTTLSSGNSSRMIPNASGKMAPPQPWMTRAAIITSMFVASAASSVPSPRIASAATSVRSLPNMSPSLPTIGVSTDALSR